MRTRMNDGRTISLLKSVLHNVGVVIVGFVIAFIGTRIDKILGARGFMSAPGVVLGVVLLVAGFLLRVWATFRFYELHMKVIALEPQDALITSGPYAFSRNPLYLGGNVFIFFGAAIAVGSPAAVVFTAIHIPVIDFFIRGEERQLAERFGDEWRRYRKRVRRWI
jgi:protein-S-isoprenylcysteine O-methyltransferase Ste14